MSEQKPSRIIVIEDNPADVRLLRHALDEHRGLYQLEVLPDGEAALHFIRAHCHEGGPEPCLIVLDLHLPRYDGTAVLQAIRQEPALSGVRVAVLTTVASPQQEAEVMRLGVQLYRRKPSQLEEFIVLAGELLEICNQRVESASAV